MPTKQAAQVPLARKAAALKAKKAGSQPQPQPTPHQVKAQNRKAQAAADAFTEELEQYEQDKQVPRLLSKAQVLQRVPFTYPTLWAWMRKGSFPRARTAKRAGSRAKSTPGLRHNRCVDLKVMPKRRLSMRHKHRKPPRPLATGTAATLGYQVIDNGPHHSRPQRQRQGSPQAPRAFAFSGHGDRFHAPHRNLQRDRWPDDDWQSRASRSCRRSRWRAVAYATMQVAMAALPAPKVKS